MRDILEHCIRAKITKIGKNYVWTVFSCCVTVFMKDWHWRSYLDMGSANWLKSLVLAAKYPCGVFLWKNGSLGELRHQGFIAFLMVDWVCYSFVIVKELRMGKTMGLNSVEERVRKCDRENNDGNVRSNQSIDVS